MSESKTFHSNDRNESGVPLTYVFKSRGATRRPDSARLPSSRLTPILPSPNKVTLKKCPPRTYQHKRLQFDGHDDSDYDMLNRSGIAVDKESLKATRDEDERRSRFENVPKSYQMKSSYRREDPPASHKLINVEATKKPIENTLIHRKVDSKGCDCWFYLYNGYCNGHQSDSRSYFNSDPYSSNDRLTEWTRSPSTATGQCRENYEEYSAVRKSAASLDYRNRMRHNVREHSKGGEDFADENVLYDG